jgi:hypothetical protein
VLINPIIRTRTCYFLRAHLLTRDTMNSLHSLIPFSPIFLITNCQIRNSTQYSVATASSGTQLSSNSSCLRSSLYSLGAAPIWNTASSIVACWIAAAEMCLPHLRLAASATLTTENTVLLLLRAFASAGMFLVNSCPTMNYNPVLRCHEAI